MRSNPPIASNAEVRGVLQAIYEKVSTHLLTQNAQALRDIVVLDDGSLSGLCAYHAQGGLRCAVGCLIDDGLYHDEFEGEDLMHSLLTSALLQSQFFQSLPTGNLTPSDWDLIWTLLYELQEVHDLHDVSDWKDSLQRLGWTDYWSAWLHTDFLTD
jgi:hypothetical protein